MKRKLTKGMLMTALICGTISVLPFGGAVAYAEDAAAEDAALQGFNLDQIVVTATRVPVTEFDAHANVSVITAKDIENRHYTTVKDALRDVPGAVITDYGSPGYDMSNSIRLNGSNQVVVLVDGVRVSQSDILPLASTTFVPVENIERIETLKGAASALYGADAKGGVINIITKKAASEPVTKIRAQAGNFGVQEYAFYTEGKSDNKKLTYRINAKINKLGDAKDGHGDKIRQDLDAKTFGVFLRNEFSEGNDLSIGYNKYKSEFEYEDKFYDFEMKSGETNTDELTISSNQKFNDNLSNNLTFKKLNFDHKYGGDVSDVAYDLDSWEINDQLTAKLSASNTLVVGLSYMRDEFDYKYAYKVAPWGYTSALKETITKKAIYLQDEWKFAKKWSLNTGLRYDKHSTAGSAFTPRFNLGYEADKNNNVYLSYSRFFVAPTAYQYYDVMYGNRNLEPEKGYTWELGWNHKFDDTAALATHLFYRSSHDAFGYDPITYQTVNIEDEEAKGFDVQFRKAFGNNFTGSLGYTYTNTKQEQPDSVSRNANGYIPKHAINLGLSYNSRKFEADLMARAALNRKGRGEGFFPANDYVIVDLAVNYKPIKELKTFIKVNNLFDKFYAEHSAVTGYSPRAWYTMPGRSIVAGVEYSF